MRDPSAGIERGGAWLAAALAVLAIFAALAAPARAQEPITVDPKLERIDIGVFGPTANAKHYEGRGDNLQVAIIAGADGAGGRMSVSATSTGTNPQWLVFALRNTTDKQVERWLVAERFTLVGSGIVWPDLDARRIEAVTASAGYRPDRIQSERADIFRLTIEPGQTVTYVVELASDRMARIALWQSGELELRLRNRQLFNGIMLGVTGLLGLFLIAVFAANHVAIFPSAALLVWSVLGLLCVDFGFWHKLFHFRPEDNAHYRAAAEAATAAALVIFLFTFLRLRMLHGFWRMLFAVWMVGQLALVGVALLDPRLAATVARLSFSVIGTVGGLLILLLAVRGQDRALTLVPSWLLFLVWMFAAFLVLSGRLAGDGIQYGLVAGLVLIMVLMGLSVTQYAFRSQDPQHTGGIGQLQARALAIDGSGSAVWEWTARRDEIKVDPAIEQALGINPGELSGKVGDFVRYMHQADRERFEQALQAVRDRTSALLRMDVRLRHADSSYRFFELEAGVVAASDRRQMRCVGLLRDVTDARRSQERLLHDAVHDSLTGLPNRALFLDRLGVALGRAAGEPNLRPIVIFVDLDKFKSVNSSFGLIVGDSLLLTTARRLARHLAPQDTLARVGGDQFAILMLGEQDPRELALLAERIRRALRTPIKIAGQEIILTASLGIAIYDGQQASHTELLREAEIAMYRAKREGSDRIEIFKASMRSERDDRVAIESELRRAIDSQQLTLLYQPIIALSTEELAGFEALVRWEHPRLGLLNPAEFVPVAEETDLIVRLGNFVLNKAVADITRWQQEVERPDVPLFISVNVSSRELLHQDLIQQVRNLLGRAGLARGSLRIEITESLVMENPEQATVMLDLLRAAGVELSLDDFGVGYSSLSYLQRFPFHSLKIDRSLVHASANDGKGNVIVRSIVALAHELGKKVVAEGIETREDAAFLRQIGCEFGQGFYYGEPMPEREVEHLLKMIRRADRRMRRRGYERGQGRRRDGGTGGRQGGPMPDGGPPPVPTSGGPPPGAGPAGAAAGFAYVNGAEPPLPMPGAGDRPQPPPFPPVQGMGGGAPWPPQAPAAAAEPPVMPPPMPDPAMPPSQAWEAPPPVAAFTAPAPQATEGEAVEAPAQPGSRANGAAHLEPTLDQAVAAAAAAAGSLLSRMDGGEAPHPVNGPDTGQLVQAPPGVEPPPPAQEAVAAPPEPTPGVRAPLPPRAPASRYFGRGDGSPRPVRPLAARVQSAGTSGTSALPPNVAASLARLAGTGRPVKAPPSASEPGQRRGRGRGDEPGGSET